MKPSGAGAGMKPELRDYVGIFLAYKGEEAVRAWFAIHLIDASGAPEPPAYPLIPSPPALAPQPFSDPVTPGERLEVFTDEEEGSVFEETDDHWGKTDAIYRRRTEEGERRGFIGAWVRTGLEMSAELSGE